MIMVEDWVSAIKFASKFPDLGNEKKAITQANEALLRPENYRQIGKDINILIEDGKKALLRRYEKAIKAHKGD